jgi:hypothetical protein
MIEKETDRKAEGFPHIRRQSRNSWLLVPTSKYTSREVPPKNQTRKWIIRQRDPRAAEFAASLGVSPIVADLLLARGIW